MQRTRSSRTNSIQNLLQVAGYPGRGRTVFGIILDATGHYKTNDSIDYVTRLKIIDHSLNSTKKPFKSSMESFVYVFIFSESVAQAPQIGRIGDVIRLDNFEFDSYQRVIKAVFHKKRSTWSIYDGRKNANMTSIINSEGRPPRLREPEKAAMHKLRVWSENYYSNKTLYNMAWFKRAFPNKPDPKKIYELKDVDVVVKLVTDLSVRVGEQFYHKLIFVDKFKNLYMAELKGLLSGVDRGDVMKLRSITIILHNKEYKINFSSYSNFMILQKGFRDAREILDQTKRVRFDVRKLKNQFFEELHLDKRSKEILGPNSYVYSTSNKEKTPLNMELVRKNFESSFPILRNFDFESLDLEKSSQPVPKSKNCKSLFRGSAVLLKHANLPILTLSEVAKSLKQKKKKKKGDNQLFRVKASIKTIENLDFNSNFKIFSVDKNKTWELNTKKRKFDGDEKIIFYNVFGLKDSSLGSRDSPVPAYLITYNENPKYIYDLWRLLPDPLAVKDWLKLENSRKEKFVKSLAGLKNVKKQFDLVLQLVEADGGRVYLKLIDCIFWFTGS